MINKKDTFAFFLDSEKCILSVNTISIHAMWRVFMEHIYLYGMLDFMQIKVSVHDFIIEFMEFLT